MDLFRIRCGLLLTCGAALCMFGCGAATETGPETVAVSGTVTLNGEPLADADVRFINGDFASVGRTNAEGFYELIQGSVPGENTVTVSKIEGGSSLDLDPESGMDAGQFEAMQLGAGGDDPALPDLPRELIPAEYSDPAASELKYTVPEGGTTSADLRLSTE